jgi:peptide chain release factor 1
MKTDAGATRAARDTSLPTISFAAVEARVDVLRARRAELELALADPAVLADPQRAQNLSREYRSIVGVINLHDELRRAEQECADTKELLSHSEPELVQMAETELAQLTKRADELRRRLLRDIMPRNPDWDKSCIVEIRAAAGGEESALFAGDLYRMYTRYADGMGWKYDVLSSRPSDLDGFREIIFAVEGDSPYRFLRFESGVHRVQRVPRTEASGRIHTSTVTIAVLPEVEETEIKIDPSELKIEVFRAGGHGGQLVNKIESAVRITHIPTGIQASCQDERSQTRNKAKAMKIILARIRDSRASEDQAKLTAHRRNLVGTGERSEKIRTYNFPQNRITDHRIELTLYNLEKALDGGLAEFHQALMDRELENWLKDDEAVPKASQ